MSRAARVAAVLLGLAGCGEEDVTGPVLVPATPAFVATGIDLAASTIEARSVAWGDCDRDGRMDVIVAGPSGTFLNLNRSGKFYLTAPGLPNAFEASLAWGDYDGDGRLDVLIAGGRLLASPVAQVWHNEGEWEFAKPLPDLMALGVEDQAACWGDYDNDGDLDVSLVGMTESSAEDARLFLNNGGVGFSEAAFAVEGAWRGGIAPGDCDNDGDLDLAVAGSGSSGYITRIYTNEDGSFTDAGVALTGVTVSSVAWGDYDNDGDLDLAVIGSSLGLGLIARIYENDGGGGFTDIGAGLLGVWNGSASWGDYDNDGDLDLLVGGQTDVYRNDGAGTFTRLAIDFPSAEGQAAWGDYDGDGDLDIAIAVSTTAPNSSRCTVYRNTVDAPNDPPDPPAGLAAVVTGAGPVYDVAFGWDPSTDDKTPTPGLTYNLRVVEDSSGIEVMPGMSIVGGANDGKRLIPAMGNVQHAGPPSPPAPAGRSWTLHLPAGTYRWSVQAVDTAFAASTWPAEETVDVP